MESYDNALAPEAFGLNNTGVICYFNSFLQTLAGCTSMIRAVLNNIDYLQLTATGRATLNYFSSFAEKNKDGEIVSRSQPLGNVSLLSSTVLQALVSDLALRRPHVRFGRGQESASEALVHFLDMIEPQSLEHISRRNHPLTKLFLHHIRCELHCRKCKNIVSTNSDYAVNFNLFHFDKMTNPPKNTNEFSKALRFSVSTTEDYRCSKCLCVNCGSSLVDNKCNTCGKLAEKTTVFRIYNLTMAPEIIFCMFNLYVGFGGSRISRYFPEYIELPTNDKTTFRFKLIGQVEHSGSLSGGHYWARGLRARNNVFMLNDNSVSPTVFTPTSNTYIVAYHYVDTI